MSAAFLASALIQFALGLVVAWLLGPAEFGAYALALSAAVLLQTLTLEWLRLAATRFHHAEEGGGLSARLHALFVRIAAGLVVAALVLALFGGVHRWLFALVPLTALAAGFADFRAALMRAEFNQRGYALFMLVRNGLAIVILPLVASVFATGEAALAGFLGSLVLASAGLEIARKLRATKEQAAIPAEGVPPDLASLLRYSAPIVLTNCLYLGLFFGLRSGVALVAGMAAAGQFSLALDFGLKLFTTIGTALDLMLFQLAVRDAREKGDAAGQARLQSNLALVLAIILPMALGLALVIGPLEPWLVGPDFRGAFAAYLLALLPGIALYALVQYALHPFLQLEHRTRRLIEAAFAALVAGAFVYGVMRYGALGPVQSVACVLIAAMLAAALRLLLVIGREGVPGAAFWGGLLLALAGMAGAVLLLRLLLTGLPALVLMISAGALVYVLIAYATNLAGIRNGLRMRSS